MIIFNRPQRGIYNIKTNQDIGTMIKKDRMVRSSQMITISLMEPGISAAKTQGIVVENIKTWVILLSLIHIFSVGKNEFVGNMYSDYFSDNTVHGGQCVFARDADCLNVFTLILNRRFGNTGGLHQYGRCFCNLGILELVFRSLRNFKDGRAVHRVL